MTEAAITNISWRIYKSGVLTPVVSYEDVNGPNIKNATRAFPSCWIKNNKLGVGAKFLVGTATITQKATDEEYDKVLKNLFHCPYCGHPTNWNEGRTQTQCVNHQCPGIKVAKTQFFFQVLAMPGLTHRYISLACNAGYKDVGKILNIPYDEIVEFKDIDKCMATKICNSCKFIKSGVEFTKLMYASCCFDNIGETKARKMLSQFSKEGLYALENGYLPWWKDEEELKTQKCYINADADTKAFMCGLIPFYEFVAQNNLKYYVDRNKYE